ncbi:methyltransferase domain-containing protein [Pseudactinotalea sp. HY160]|uniref:methyltransferase domain-containing protein n=1 Tax=Pseudactinotalea sp. HY160 TaxID=2654490 RepID=UPI00351BE691
MGEAATDGSPARMPTVPVIPGEPYDGPLALECAHFRRDECRSCTLLPLGPDEQGSRAMRRLRGLLPDPGIEWSAPVRSAAGGFRTKAKMVVTGTSERPVLGLPGAPGTAPADLRDCPLYPPELTAALEHVAWFITRAALPPYRVDRRRGELKHVLLTLGRDEDSTGRLMLRFVLRSEAALPRIREHLPALLERIPGLEVVSANLHPAHAATLEGEREIVLTEAATLPVDLGGLTFHVRPRSFLQTNPAVAAELYRQGADWAGAAHSVWDLYCGVGPFGLHVARADPSRAVVGVETSREAVDSARLTARSAGLRARFEVADATSWAIEQPAGPDLVIVNPPRRGIGTALASWLDASSTGAVLYSSCNPASLARDLARMPQLRPVRARLFEMFPHTAHSEVLVLLRRAA